MWERHPIVGAAPDRGSGTRSWERLPAAISRIRPAVVGAASSRDSSRSGMLLCACQNKRDLMRYRYFICDVFTDIRFGGNPLAVLPEATGLDDMLMQQIAREFNFSESTFVFPPEAGGDRHVRIFTPKMEVPFAGHPNIGTAFALARDGAFGEIGEGIEVTFEEDAGMVPVSIHRDSERRIACELKAPQVLSLGETVPVATIAAVLSLDASDIVTNTHPPRVASVGLPFLVTEVSTRDALRRARIDISALETLRDTGIVPDVHVYTHSDDDFDLRARMFAPFDGVAEDPATGSANCALAALLAETDAAPVRDYSWRIAQGVEMGRPSVLLARCSKNEAGTSTWIGGSTVLVSEGWLTLD